MTLDRLEKNLNELNRFGALDKGITRLAYTQEEMLAKQYIKNLCEQEGLTVREDACGNLIARREGRYSSLPAIACGSHIDSVIEGGCFDGTIGVLGGLEVIRRFNEKNIQTDYPLELIVFACEESSRFGVATIGSKLMAGLITKEDLQDLKDQQGVLFSQALEASGYSFDEINQAKRDKEELCLFLEMHIEQGPVLENENKQIGIVTGIASPTRIHVEVFGKASHSGSTMMNMRKDALLGASEIALATEEAAQKEVDFGTVATVGVMEVKPGAMNVVPGLVDMKIDVRSISYESKQRVIHKMLDTFTQVERQRDLKVKWTFLSDEQPVQLDDEVIQTLSQTAESLDIPYLLMPSGAGHDAMNMAQICPTGLIFVPSRDGLSHHPEEFTQMEDIARGIDVLEKTILKYSFLSDTSKIRT